MIDPTAADEALTALGVLGRSELRTDEAVTRSPDVISQELRQLESRLRTFRYYEGVFQVQAYQSSTEIVQRPDAQMLMSQREGAQVRLELVENDIRRVNRRRQELQAELRLAQRVTERQDQFRVGVGSLATNANS